MRDKTTCQLDGRCQQSDVVYCYKLSSPEITGNHPYYYEFTEKYVQKWITKTQKLFQKRK